MVKFILAEISLLLVISLGVALIGVLGFGRADPKFDDRGNIEIQVLLSIIYIVPTVLIFALGLFFKKCFPVSLKAVFWFTLFYVIYMMIFVRLFESSSRPGGFVLFLIGSIVFPALAAIPVYVKFQKSV